MDLSSRVCDSVHNFHGVITRMMMALYPTSTLGAATVDFDSPTLSQHHGSFQLERSTYIPGTGMRHRSYGQIADADFDGSVGLPKEGRVKSDFCSALSRASWVESHLGHYKKVS
ncbi:hypothetical protein PGTUg99_012627 [Puccinia graminis f. sp. tritici]|uniref:Uncharacterized protein n=1 Tax=Puccinia graminis f. sp. tritici TaxID=56615 RepID=A0A5B0N8Y5_PUCGR|nr:hypothetical protein PGTUg99_012627 [Puccinia graminis f. sp. tritici]